MVIELVDGLINRLIQLHNHRKRVRQSLLEGYVTPAYEAFEIIHQAYLDSFERYREMIQQDAELAPRSPILSIIEKENLFSANQRAKLFELASAVDDEVVGELVDAIYRYLIDARLVNPLANEERPDIVHTQLWRQSLIGELSNIFDEDWQWVFDSSASRPPYSPAEIEQEIERRLGEYGIAPDADQTILQLKRALAIERLDGLVREMQSAYQEVSGAYLRVKRQLEG